jgi:hypothetical protein
MQKINDFFLNVEKHLKSHTTSSEAKTFNKEWQRLKNAICPSLFCQWPCLSSRCLPLTVDTIASINVWCMERPKFWKRPPLFCCRLIWVLPSPLQLTMRQCMALPLPSLLVLPFFSLENRYIFIYKNKVFFHLIHFMYFLYDRLVSRRQLYTCGGGGGMGRKGWTHIIQHQKSIYPILVSSFNEI